MCRIFIKNLRKTFHCSVPPPIFKSIAEGLGAVSKLNNSHNCYTVSCLLVEGIIPSIPSIPISLPLLFIILFFVGPTRITTATTTADLINESLI